MKPGSNLQRRVVDRLMAEGIVSPEAHATVLAHVSRHGGRMEDVLIEMGLLSEGDLLKGISTVYSTRFISTQKLYSTQIDPRILGLIPVKLIRLYEVYPILYDAQASALTVATADPENIVAFQELRLAAGVREVRPIVARPAAVECAIARAYHNDPQPFAALMRPTALSAAAAGQPLAVTRGFDMGYAAPLGEPQLGGVVQEPERQRRQPPAPIPPSTPPPAAPAPAAAPPRHMSSLVSATSASQKPTQSRDYLETVNVLVSLLENSRPDLRGHSSGVARVAQKMCDRIGLPAEHASAIRLAGYIHDLGKAGTYHLTALNVAEYDGHRIAAEKVLRVPEGVLSSVDLAFETRSAVGSMYERVDGKGLPNGLSGKDISIGARILAAADSYSDLTQNPRNPTRRILTPNEACATLAQHKGKIFDPTVIDILTHVVTGEDIRMKLLADRQSLLLVDPDPEETTVLELRLIEQGFEVRIARSMQQALTELQSREFAGVISEVDLDVPDDGLALRGKAIAEPWGRGLVWVVLTKKSDRQLAQIAFELGVDDFISKNTSADVVVAKIKQLMERRKAKSSASPRGVSGSLAEMALPDMVQILFHGRKTCALRIQAAKASGDITFAEGQVVDARFGTARGEEAFYQMIMLREGDFQIDPNATTGQRTIQMSPEALLLEGMRRVDEGLVG